MEITHDPDKGCWDSGDGACPFWDGEYGECSVGKDKGEPCDWERAADWCEIRKGPVVVKAKE